MPVKSKVNFMAYNGQLNSQSIRHFQNFNLSVGNGFTFLDDGPNYLLDIDAGVTLGPPIPKKWSNWAGGLILNLNMTRWTEDLYQEGAEIGIGASSPVFSASFLIKTGWLKGNIPQNDSSMDEISAFSFGPELQIGFLRNIFVIEGAVSMYTNFDNFTAGMFYLTGGINFGAIFTRLLPETSLFF